MHVSARANRAGILIAAAVMPAVYVTASATLHGLTRFVGVLSLLLLASLIAAAIVSMAIDFGLHTHARRHLDGTTFGRVVRLPSSVHCGLCGRSEVQVGDLRLCPSCDRAATH